MGLWTIADQMDRPIRIDPIDAAHRLLFLLQLRWSYIGSVKKMRPLLSTITSFGAWNGWLPQFGATISALPVAISVRVMWGRP